MRLNWMNIFALIEQELPLKPLKIFPNTISRCAHYILLTTYFVWLLKPFKESLRLIFTNYFFSNSCYQLMSHVTCHMSCVTCHMSSLTFRMSLVMCHLKQTPLSSAGQQVTLFPLSKTSSPC